MYSASLLLACVLASQSAIVGPVGSAEVVLPPDESRADERSDSLVPARSLPNVAPLEAVPVDIAELPERSATAAEPAANLSAAQNWVDQALTPAEGARLAGRPLTLITAVGMARDGRQQLAVVHSYWNAVAAVAQYHLRRRGQQILERVTPRPGDEAKIRAARASAAAELDEAEVAVIAMQHELAMKTSFALGAAELPLPSDRPHAGPYQTRYAETFSARPAPPAAQLINRTLPLRYRAIDARARAVEASEQALAASRAAYDGGSANFESVLTALAGCFAKQQALMRSVCDYNHEIAEYAVLSFDGPIDGVTLVSMLIGPPAAEHFEPVALPEGVGRVDGTIPAAPATWNEPRLAPTHNPVQPAGRLEPVPAVPRQPTLPAGDPGRSGAPVDVAPKPFLADGKLVPIAPDENVSPPSDEPEAPKLLVVPVDEDEPEASRQP
ncbi:MAG: hypothetical protein JW888_16035 [Pirellulales bacterium]|nr:hypothetical protein [Pirellulales bacterium]